MRFGAGNVRFGAGNAQGHKKTNVRFGAGCVRNGAGALRIGVLRENTTITEDHVQY